MKKNLLSTLFVFCLVVAALFGSRAEARVYFNLSVGAPVCVPCPPPVCRPCPPPPPHCHHHCHHGPRHVHHGHRHAAPPRGPRPAAHAHKVHQHRHPVRQHPPHRK